MSGMSPEQMARQRALLEAVLQIGYAALAADAETGRYEGLREAREIVRSLLDLTEGETGHE